jgi:hypothetical protein
MVDYLSGLLFIALPFLMGWTGAAYWTMTMLGVAVLLYSILTRYELGLVKVIPMMGHLVLDLLGGLLLVAAPFFLFDDPSARLWYIILGLLEIGAALFSSNHPHLAGYEDELRNERDYAATTTATTAGPGTMSGGATAAGYNNTAVADTTTVSTGGAGYTGSAASLHSGTAGNRVADGGASATGARSGVGQPDASGRWPEDDDTLSATGQRTGVREGEPTDNLTR